MCRSDADAGSVDKTSAVAKSAVFIFRARAFAASREHKPPVGVHCPRATRDSSRLGSTPGTSDAARSAAIAASACTSTGPPPLKWSDLRYVFDIKEDCNGKEALQARRDRREAAPGRCSGLAGPGHDGGDPADRCERGDLLSLASRVWRAED